MQLNTEGIVIRERHLGDDNRLITILTRDKGVINAYAKNARRVKSSLAAGTELLSHSNFVIFQSRDRFTVDKADVEHIFFSIRQDIEKLSLASYLAQLCSELIAQEDRPDPHYIRLMLNSLYMLEKNLKSIWQIKPIFELRLLSMSGYMPDLVGCRSCGCFEAEKIFFLPASGELCCSNCLGNSIPGAVEVAPSILAAMRYIIYSDFEKLFNFQLSPEGLRQLSKISQEFVLAQLERTFTSLDFFCQLTENQ